MPAKPKNPGRARTARAAQGEAALAALEKLRGHIPWAFGEKGEFKPDEVAAALRGMNLHSADRGARYRFDWAGSQNAFAALYAPVAAALAPRRDLSRNFDDTANLFIRGDNLEAMKILRNGCAGRVKMIYIDPPYNTGGDFVYKDNFRDPLVQYLRETGQVDETGKAVRAAARAEERKANGRKHSNWMSMMLPRLFVAREFLSDDGVMFISIDDNEVHHLRMLMNILFGENNFVGNFIVRSNSSGAKFGLTAVLHEFVLCYAKNRDSVGALSLPLSDKALAEFKGNGEDGGRYRLIPLLKSGRGWRKQDRPKMHYPLFVNPDNGRVSAVPAEGFGVEVKPIRPTTGEDGRWTWNQERAKKFCSELLVATAGKSRRGAVVWRVFRKDFLKTKTGEQKKSKIATILDGSDFFYTKGDEEIKALLGSGEFFPLPKPTPLVKHLAMAATKRDSIVMDFFAGSGTTAHAIMQLNADDKGARQCISVQLPEPTSEKSAAREAEFFTVADICEKRLRLAGDEVRKSKNGKEVDTGFRVFELSQSAFRPWRGTELGGTDSEAVQKWRAEQKLALETLPQKADAESLIFELMAEEGYPLTSAVEELRAGRNRVWRITHADAALAAEGMILHVCLDAELADDLHLRLGLRRGSRFVVRDRSLSDSQAMTLGIHCSARLI